MGNRYGLEIRAAAGPDAAGLAALLSEAGVAVGAADLAARLEALQRDGDIALVAVEWGPPSGLIAVAPVRTLDAPRPFGLITGLVVAAESRRRGIGRVLLKAAGRAARQAGCDRLLLAAGPDQAALRAFCAAAGFADEGTVLARPLLKRGTGDG
ncbi:GNAT family N-acetyltransferase [Methylobacterium sp. 13MFTsu3.1M2]|uniref:GNAT family N-acetyltransferase n=1 Tax=Methylobacterium sp. 13MFTsu3.1M2 TaxID=1502776 RepID=UPI0008F1EF2B|nr:GNAT family N-acetyltransferase [Methylobacterium sp. 13MFTsu3.1M2]SFE87869.1 Acetyltransferase (GNAT) family protein [Methylobacterium sp. 13MFTsu3.1M2]